MQRGESRLWKKIGATSPMFRVWNPDGLELNDDDIQNISVKRGADGPDEGPNDQTLEVTTNKVHGIRANQRIRLDLSTYGTNLLSNILFAEPDRIRNRFYGRIGKQTVDDAVPTRQYTTFYAAPWFNQLKTTDAGITLKQGDFIGDVLKRIHKPTGVGLPQLPETRHPAPAVQYGAVWEPGDKPVNYSDGITKWGSDLGIRTHTRRDGSRDFVTVEYMWEQALRFMPSTRPLTRSQAISPATWEQPMESRPVTHRSRWMVSDGPLSRTLGLDPDSPKIPITEHDMRHARWTTNDNQPRAVAYIAFSRQRAIGYNLPSVTVDLLRLISSASPYDRQQARQLLQLEEGDPVYLSGDWHGYLEGVHFATGIDETITPDRWDMTLSLNPAINVVGEWSPDVPAHIWESAQYPWNDETRKWDH